LIGRDDSCEFISTGLTSVIDDIGFVFLKNLSIVPFFGITEVVVVAVFFFFLIGDETRCIQKKKQHFIDTFH